jgi:cob(I)alamin adenosyltransferase
MKALVLLVNRRAPTLINLALAAVIILTAAACAGVPRTEREIYLAAEVQFTKIVDEITFARESGAITQAQVDQLEPTIRKTAAALDAARAAILKGQSGSAALDIAQAGIRALIVATKKGGS